MARPDPIRTVRMLAVVASVAFVVVVVVGGLAIARHQREAIEVAYAQVCRDQGLQPTDRPLGTSDAWLSQFELLPRGDRDHSAVWGMQGPVQLTLAGAEVAADCAAFEWWWEERETSSNGNGGRKTSWRRRSVLVAMVRLPAPYVMPRIRLETEGVFTRLGLGGRSDFQVESEEFNRLYDVRVRDEHAAIRLFDPDFQSRMLGPFAGTTFELAGDVALVTMPTPSRTPAMTGLRRGGPGGLAGLLSRAGDRLRTDPAIVHALPGVRHRAGALLQAMPDSWWRGMAQGTSAQAQP